MKLLDKDQQTKLYAAIKGEQGEEDFANYWIPSFLNSKIMVWRDVWLRNKDSHRQFDFIIYNNHSIYLIDVKNYEGNIKISKNNFMFNNINTVNNIFHKSEEHIRFFNLWLKNNNITDANLTEYLVLINENITIQSDVEENKYLIRRHQIEHFLKQIKYYPPTPFSKYLLSVIHHQRVDNPFKPPHMSNQIILPKPKCPRCFINFRTQSNRHFKCDCGYTRLREAHAFENICKYGVIYHHKNLIVRDLVVFFDGLYSNNYLKHLLNRHFKKIQGGYENPKLLPQYFSNSKSFRYKDGMIKKKAENNNK